MAGPNIGTWVKVRGASGKLAAKVIAKKYGGGAYEQGQVISQSEYNAYKKDRARAIANQGAALPYMELVTDVKSAGKSAIKEARSASRDAGSIADLRSKAQQEADRLYLKLGEDADRIKEQYQKDKKSLTTRKEKAEAKAKYEAALEAVDDRRKSLQQQKYATLRELRAIEREGAPKESPATETRKNSKKNREFLTPEQATERLRQSLSAAQTDRQMTTAINRYLKENQLSKVRRQDHSMPSAEEMVGVKFSGFSIYYPPDAKGRAAARNLIKEIHSANIPTTLTKHTKEVVLANGRNKDDEKWGREYDIPDFKAAASGGNGSVVFYNGKADVGTFVHEMGHNLANATYDSPEPSRSSAYSKAYAKEKSVSNYSFFSGSKSEDFADAVRLYFFKKDSFREKFPLKYQVIDNLIKTGREDG